MTKTDAQAMLEALDKTHQKNMQSKEASLKFLREAGIIQDDKPEPKTKSDKKKSK
jgi:hypothetical protein